mmetsp:Transcript_69177/g.184376  ORF Transcript_69177/g.184376 Transcript_69177/m.184376 type:complete len:153 (-) Transcript_69177:106-564(-)
MTAEQLGGLVSRFNVMSAVVRRAGFLLERPLLAMTQCNLGMCALGVMVLLSDPPPAARIFLAVVTAWLVLSFSLFSAVAEVNLKLDRLPPLLNARHFGFEIDLDKRCAVDDMRACDAGLKMFNVRVDRKIMLKLGYYGIAGLSALVPRLLDT